MSGLKQDNAKIVREMMNKFAPQISAEIASISELNKDNAKIVREVMNKFAPQISAEISSRIGFDVFMKTAANMKIEVAILNPPSPTVKDEGNTKQEKQKLVSWKLESDDSDDSDTDEEVDWNDWQKNLDERLGNLN